MSWPDVGFYLDGSWSAGVLVCSPWFRPPFVQRPRSQIVVYPWPDLGPPRDPRRFARALRWLLGQASEGRRVGIGCAGGHGRTGTTLRVRATLAPELLPVSGDGTSSLFSAPREGTYSNPHVQEQIAHL